MSASVNKVILVGNLGIATITTATSQSRLAQSWEYFAGARAEW
jgi:hypothetical protein